MELWISGGAAIAAIVSAVVAIVKAASAKSASTDAAAARDESLAIQADIAASTRRSAPGEWSPLRPTTGHGVAVQNSTGAVATIVSIELADGSAPARPSFNRRRLPARVDQGDKFEFMLTTGHTGGAPTILMKWTVDGDEVVHETERTLLSA